jgi:hypothetical protein
MSYAKPIIAKGGSPLDQFLELCKFLHSVDLDAMTPEERAVALINRMDGQVGMGGFDQYFGNDGLVYPRECVGALRWLDMCKRADLVESALRSLPRDTYGYEDCCNQELQSVLSELEKELFALEEEENIYQKIMTFVAAHVDKFGYQP